MLETCNYRFLVEKGRCKIGGLHLVYPLKRIQVKGYIGITLSASPLIVLASYLPCLWVYFHQTWNICEPT